MSDTENTIVANVDRNHTQKEMKFSFRTIKDEETGVTTKRPTIEVKLPILTVDGVIAVLQAGGKGLDLLLSAVEDVYASAAKSMLADDTSITSENFPYDKLTWEAIANQPESERKGRGIAKEVWEDFLKSYITVMPGLTGKSDKQVEKQAAILGQKFNPLKNHEDKENILPKFKDMLGIYMANAPEAENFEACISFLLKKADDILNADKNANLVENLGFE